MSVCFYARLLNDHYTVVYFGTQGWCWGFKL